MEGSIRFRLLLWTNVPQRMNLLRRAYAGAVLSSGLTPAAGEETVPLLSPAKAIASCRLHRLPNLQREGAKDILQEPPSYEDAHCHRIPLLPAHFGDRKRGDHAHTIWRQRPAAIRGRPWSKGAAT